MAKGNDGNYLQHSVEVALARLLAASKGGSLHLCVTHGMAPFEQCGTVPAGQTTRHLYGALGAASRAARQGEEAIVAAYRATSASLSHYPNTGELIAATLRRDNLNGGIAEVNDPKVAALQSVWAGTGMIASKTSWRAAVAHGAILACPQSVGRPWLFSMDPMTFVQGRKADDDKIRDTDRGSLATTLGTFAKSGLPGVALIFVYAVRPDMRAPFWNFANALANDASLTLETYWMTHQGGNRNLAAVLYANWEPPEGWPPSGINAGRG